MFLDIEYSKSGEMQREWGEDPQKPMDSPDCAIKRKHAPLSCTPKIDSTKPNLNRYPAKLACNGKSLKQSSTPLNPLP